VRNTRLFWRIFIAYLFVVVLCITAVGFYAVHSARDFYVAHTERELAARARLVREQLGPQIGVLTPQQLQQTVRALGAASATRITIINAALPGAVFGKVLADSEVAPATMMNHGKRPEFLAALKGQVGHRTGVSPTLHVPMTYVAIPLERGGRAVAVVRTAIPLTAVNDALDALYVRIALSSVIVALLAALVGWFVSRRITRPLRDITEGAERLAAGDFQRRLAVPGTLEFATVAESLNHMAGALDQQIKTLTRERNERDAVLSSMVEGVVAVDNEQNVIALNRAAARLLGVREERIEGRSIQEIVRNRDLQELVAAILSGGEPAEADVMVRLGFEERFLQASGSLLRGGADDEVVGAVVVLNDVTRLKRLEVVRSDFVANVSHELKTPVTSIKGFAETLLDGAMADEHTACRFLTIIAGQADRLHSIIEDLLALSTLEAGERGVALEDADLCDVLTVAVDVCTPKAERKHIAITTACAEPVLARINPPLLEQAVVNLVDNAIKYSSEGSLVEVRLDQLPRELLISVRDQGSGIGREHLARLFERFYRVDKARSRDLGGTGLGLAIVKHIAQVHGGDVSVESVVGEGSVFRIHLPRA
jgi:two-component system, OmpR family, phosphate regulon sensor histidine kinase PhoR